MKAQNMFDTPPSETPKNPIPAEPPKRGSKKVNINQAVLDGVNVTLEAYLGNAELTVGELNELTSGAVVELSSLLSDAVELRLNGVCVGRGELVAVGDKFAVKITALA